MTMTIEELDRRVSALESQQYDTTQTLRWVVTKLARVTAVQDEHTLHLERLSADLRRVEKKVDDLTTSLPSIVAGAMREVLKER
jgi:uncharacterized coiled-coil protein SlyX